MSDDPRDLRRSDYPVIRELQLRWSDVDIYGHVNNAVHYLLIDTAVNGWLIDATGTDIRRLAEIGIVAETSCRYLGELHFPGTVDVGLTLERLGTSSVVYSLGLFGRDEAPAALGRFVHVYVDQDTRRPVPVPEPVRKALDQLRSGRPA